jgi:hypothetical protein
VSRLLTAENGSGSEHLFKNILIANIGAQHANARVTQGDLQAHVRHRGGHNGRSTKHAPGLKVTGGKQKNGVSIHDTAIGITEECSIGIAVEGYTQVELPVLLRDCLSENLGMQSSAILVNVPAIRRCV